MTCSFIITPETSAHLAEIEAIHDTVFGPGRFARTAFRVREGISADPNFCFVALEDDAVAGSVRLTKVEIGKKEAYLLGPLCVADPKQGGGIGKALVQKACEAVHKKHALPVILVGDAPYYAPLGFERAPRGIQMPGPVDYARLLVAWPANITETATYQGVMRGVSSSS
ncbi:MAG: N-acetyltransferase [Hyphomicrobiales bacterium]